MKLGIVTDPHLAETAVPGAAWHNPLDFANAARNLERALARHRAAGVDAIVLLGDLANGGDEAAHLIGLALIEAGGLPVWAVPGNHDTDEDLHALATRIGARSGSPIRIPDGRGEVVAGIRLTGLSPQVVEAGRGWIHELPDVAAWGDEPAVLLTHFPAISRADAAAAAGLKYAGDVRNHAEIADALRGRTSPTIVLHGHHHFRDATTAGTLLQIGFASLIEPPHEAALVEIERGDGELTVRVAHEPVAPSTVERLPVLTSSAGAWRFTNSAWMPNTE